MKRAHWSGTVSVLAGSAAAANLVGLLVAPLLTRHYEPAVFGVYAMFVALLNVISVVAAGRYDLAIPTASSFRESLALVRLSTLLVLLSALVLPMLTGLLTLVVPGLADFPLRLLPWLAVAAFLAGQNLIWQSWMNRRRQYRQLSRVRLVGSLGVSAVQVGCIYLAPGVEGLVLGLLAGSLVGLASGPRRAMCRALRQPLRWDRAAMRAAAARHSDFPLVGTTVSLLNQAAQAALVFLIGALAGKTEIGLFSLMLRMVTLPLGIVGGAVGQVLYRDGALAHARGESLRPLVRRLTIELLLLGALPLAVLWLVGEPLFAWAFGAQWAVSGAMASTYALYALCQFVMSPLGYVPIIVGQQRRQLLVSMTGNAVMVGSMYLGLVHGGLSEGVRYMSVAMPCYFVLSWAWTWHVARGTAHA